MLMILHLEQSQQPNSVEVKARMEGSEFEQLLGNLDGLRVFASKTITEPASVVQTGARHSYAKYLLFPVKLRRQFQTDEYDFEKLRCGALRYRERLYVIYEVGRKGLNPHGFENEKTVVGVGSRGTKDEGLAPDLKGLRELEERHRVR